MIDIESIDEDIREVAFQVHNNYGRTLELADIEQEIRLAVLTHESWFNNLKGKLLRDRLRVAGYQYCEKERSRYAFYSDQFIYSSNDIRKLLQQWFSEDISDVEKLDLENAWAELSPRQRDVLLKRYTTDIKISEYERKLMNQAVKQLTFSVNGYRAARTDTEGHEGPGGRKVVSNATAMVMGNWEE